MQETTPFCFVYSNAFKFAPSSASFHIPGYGFLFWSHPSSSADLSEWVFISVKGRQSEYKTIDELFSSPFSVPLVENLKSVEASSTTLSFSISWIKKTGWRVQYQGACSSGRHECPEEAFADFQKSYADWRNTFPDGKTSFPDVPLYIADAFKDLKPRHLLPKKMPGILSAWYQIKKDRFNFPNDISSASLGRDE
jgi:hypothetical protein